MLRNFLKNYRTYYLDTLPASLLFGLVIGGGSAVAGGYIPYTTFGICAVILTIHYIFQYVYVNWRETI